LDAEVIEDHCQPDKVARETALAEAQELKNLETRRQMEGQCSI
jgi:hypothetical protein